MLGLGILALILFWIVSIIRNRNYDVRRKYSSILAASLELDGVFEEAYLGRFEFDEALPREEFWKSIEMKFDSGVESRLASHFAERLPKWVLAKAVEKI